MFQIGDYVCYPMHGVGTVESIENMESGLSKYAVLVPAVDFESMTSVVAIIDYPGKGETHEQN